MDHKTMVVLGVEGEADLLRWKGILSSLGPTSQFMEPDIGNQATALASLLVNGSPVRSLRLL